MFALTLQDALEVVSLWHPEVRVIAYLVDVVRQGPKAAVSNAYYDLCNQAAEAGLKMQPAKSAVYSHNARNYSHNARNADETGNLLGFLGEQ